MRSNPSVIASERVARGLATDLPTDVAEGLTDYYSQATREGIYPSDGGGEDAAKADLEFYATAGQLSGPADSLAVEDFWDFGPLAAAREAGG
jgi:NitT/TauT family transport system substrate-binding protein